VILLKDNIDTAGLATTAGSLARARPRRVYSHAMVRPEGTKPV